jgi:large subunit ribosomal protein L17e
MSTLMASADGIRFLSTEDLLLKQLTKSFAQLDPVRPSKKLPPCCLPTNAHVKFTGTPPIDPIFSEVRFSSTLTYGYLEMLGTLSAYKEGVEYVTVYKLYLVGMLLIYWFSD